MHKNTARTDRNGTWFYSFSLASGFRVSLLWYRGFTVSLLHQVSKFLFLGIRFHSFCPLVQTRFESFCPLVQTRFESFCPLVQTRFQSFFLVSGLRMSVLWFKQGFRVSLLCQVWECLSFGSDKVSEFLSCIRFQNVCLLVQSVWPCSACGWHDANTIVIIMCDCDHPATVLPVPNWPGLFPTGGDGCGRGEVWGGDGRRVVGIWGIHRLGRRDGTQTEASLCQKVMCFFLVFSLMDMPLLEVRASKVQCMLMYKCHLYSVCYQRR